MQEQRIRPLFQVIGLALIGVLWVIVLFFVANFTNAYIERLAILIGINIILTVALNLSNGFTGVFSLGHIGFMAIGAYTGALFTLPPSLKGPAMLPGLPSWFAAIDLSVLPDPVALLIAIIAGGTVAAVVAAIVGLPLMRLKGHYVAVATMGFLIIVHVVIQQADQITRGARGMAGIPPYDIYWLVWIFVAITLYVAWRVVRSPYGRAMMAVRENDLAAQSVGVNILRSRNVAFVVSAFFTAMGGVLWAHLITSVAPSAFYFVETFAIITMLVVGGMGSISGSVMGAAILTIIPELLRQFESGVQIGPIQLPEMYGSAQIVLGVAFILVMIFRRQGIMGTREVVPGAWIQRLLQPSKGQPAMATSAEGSAGAANPGAHSDVQK